MNNGPYEALRQFADSWGLLYMMAIFLVVVVLLLRPGARRHAEQAARIPLEDEPAGDEGPQAR